MARDDGTGLVPFLLLGARCSCVRLVYSFLASVISQREDRATCRLLGGPYLVVVDDDTVEIVGYVLLLLDPHDNAKSSLHICRAENLRTCLI